MINNDSVVLTYPDTKLRRIAKHVDNIQEILPYVPILISLMKKYDGAGLAAPQVDWPVRVFVVNHDNQDLCFVNPEIKAFGDYVVAEEGCLSVPGVFEKIRRQESVQITGNLVINDSITPIDMTTSGFLARCIQHEYDHLEGRLFIDHLSMVKQGLLKTKFLKKKGR